MANMDPNNNIDEISGTETTGHEWDGLKELDTPMPKWWLYTLYGTIVFSVIYMVLYPAWPLLETNTKGTLGYSSRAEVAEVIAAAKQDQQKYLTKITGSSLEDIRKDEDLFQFSLAGGEAAYKVNCLQCHGAGAEGSPGYPNLNDDDWLWGGKVEDIHLTIKNGIRYEENDDTRSSEMPAFGRDELLDKKQIKQVAQYVLSLSGKASNEALAEEGKAIYAENCASCHGETGKGDVEQGAPNLTDAIWLYGSDENSVIDTITNSRQGVMPGWAHRLDEATVKQLALYIHALGGGK